MSKKRCQQPRDPARPGRKPTTGQVVHPPLPESEAPIRLCEYRRVAALVDRSDLVAATDKILRPFPAKGGRNRDLHIRSFWIIAILVAQGNRSMLFTEIYGAALRDLPGTIQFKLGFRNSARVPLVTIAMFRRLFRTLDKRLRIQKLPESVDAQESSSTGESDVTDETDATVECETTEPADDCIRTEQLGDPIEALIGMSVPQGIEYSGSQSLDATSVKSWGVGHKDKTKCADKDARWGYHTDRGQVRSKDGSSKLFYGYDAHLTAATRTIDGTPADQPEVITGLALVPAATDVADAALPLLTRLALLNTFAELLDDRAYSYKTEDRWQNKIHDLGAKHVLDLHETDQGARDVDGVQMIAGCAHCPFSPENLASLTKPSPLADSKEKTTAAWGKFNESIAEREKYKLRLVANGDKSARYQCPALAGTVRCGARPETLNAGDDLPLVAGPDDLSAAPKVCTQSSVTIAHTARGKLIQEHYWGSPRWKTSFNRRTVIERKNGYLKNTKDGKIQRGNWQVMGLIQNALMVALTVVAHNLRIARNWAAKYGKTHIDPVMLAPDPEYMPNLGDHYPDDGLSPPVVA